MAIDDAWVYKKHAAKAVAAMNKDGCYWFDERRPYYSTVPDFLREAGYPVVTFNPPPDFEFVLYLADQHPPTKVINAIGKLRSEMRLDGTPEEELPTRLP